MSKSLGHGFGLLVKRERLKQGISQEELAIRAGMSKSAIASLETGRTLRPHTSTIQKITIVLGIRQSVEDFLSQAAKITPEMLPSQDPLVRIEANSNNKLELQTSFTDDDDKNTIEAYRSQFLEIITKEIDRYDQNRNRPQAAHFLPRHRALASELSKPVEEINFATVYLAVNRLNIARETAILELARTNTEWPTFDPDEKEAIDSLCLLSGPLVMASSLGRKLVTDNAMYNLKEADEAEADRLLSFYIKEVKELGVVSRETDAFLESIDLPTELDPTPQRTRRVKFALVGSLMILTAGAAVVSVATLPTAAAIGASSLAFLTYIWSKKVIENDPDFKSLVQSGGSTLQDSSSKISDGSAELIRKLGSVFRSNSIRLQRMGEIVSEFNWVKVFARRIKNDAQLDPQKTTGRSFLLTHGESIFDAAFATPEGNNRSYDISEKNGLDRAIC